VKKQIYIKSTRTKVRTNEVINAETEPTRLEIFWLNTNKDKEKKGDEMEKKIQLSWVRRASTI